MRPAHRRGGLSARRRRAGRHRYRRPPGHRRPHRRRQRRVARRRPVADHWSYLEGPASFTGIYYADPEHISDDAAQWWTWPASRDTTTLVRLTRTSAGTQIAALVRYRTTTRPSTPRCRG
ncbi:hypothetical protein I552_0693 [Mycobacterium xenopi 3993]|nr:hypothetical protein I552_0693 [Mycobacterium xenopi 3993]